MNIKIDSRKVEPDDTFIALKALNGDGHNYVTDAIEKGATKVVVERGLYNVETLLVSDTKEYLVNYLKENYYDKIKNLKLIAITGTNGKTTSSYLLWQALNKLEIKCGYIGTIGFYINEKVKDLDNTTPEILDVYEMLIECKEKGCSFVVMEASSHSLALRRLDGLLFDYAVFTNLTKDHLDYHKNMLDYAMAKQKLFKMLKHGGKAIVNNDDEYKNYFLLDENKNITYGFNDSNYQIIEHNITDYLNCFKIKSTDTQEYISKLLGKYNVYNMLITIIILRELGYSSSKISKIVSTLDPPSGRMDTIIYGENKIIIDYAHTPDAVRNIIMAVKEFSKGKIYVIVGCGGNRDKTKRPEMAQIATDLSTYAIFTSDNPRFEDPRDILNDMIENLNNNNYEIVEKRQEAIKRGIQMLNSNDILLILGKGHEKYQVIKDKKIDYDDKKVVFEVIRR